jgi:hypothetical protein
MGICHNALICAVVGTLILTSGCGVIPATTEAATKPAATETPEPAPDSAPSAGAVADVVSVKVGGKPGAYTFSVGIRSPDQGCEQYADWWEIVSEAGELVYRRILLHSHVDEQPFVRSGGPVQVDPGITIWVRAHIHPTGYGGQAFKGSVQAGFAPAEMPASLGSDLAGQPPLPDSCAF